MLSEFPRTLFVTPLAFNHFTGGGVTFSNLFRGWPTDRLFTVHQDTLPLSTDVCVNYFALGPDEMPLAGPLETLRKLAKVKRSAREIAKVEPPPSGDPAKARPEGVRRFVLRSADAIFGNSSLPVSAQLSDRLAAWIEASRPDVIYTILGSIEMMDLVEKIRVRFGLPVVVHLMDDWRAERERYGLLSPLRRRRLNRLFDRGMRTARGHLAISDAMADAYGAEFGVKFEAIQNVIDSDRWLTSAKRDITAAQSARLLYAGSLYPNVQLSSLLDIAAAVARLRAVGTEVVLDVMCPEFMIGPFRSRFAAYEGTRVVPQVPREQYFQAVCQADVLLLPVNFDPSTIRLIRYSMPTKVPEYLVSGVPILLYGPEGIAQVAYAMRQGWGLAITQRSPELLEDGIKRIIDDRSLRRDLVARAQNAAASRHDAAKVRNAFRSALSRASACQELLDRHCEPM